MSSRKERRDARKAAKIKEDKADEPQLSTPNDPKNTPQEPKSDVPKEPVGTASTEQKVTVPQEPKVEKPKTKTIEVDKAKLEEMILAFKGMQDKIKRLDAVADKGRLAQYDAESSEQKYSEVKIRTWGVGDKMKLITGWLMLKDEVVENRMTGVLRAEQYIRLFHESEDVYTDIAYDEFVKAEFLMGTVLKDTREEVSGERVLTVKIPKLGRSIKINVIFVN